MSFHSFEDHSVDYVSDRNDQEHYGDDGTHVVQVAAHHQYLAEAETEVEHLRGDKGAPSKGPSLFQPRDDEGQTRRKKHVPEELESLGAKVASGLAEDLGHLLAAVFHGERDRQQRSHDDDEQDRVLVQAKPQQREGPPADAGQTLQADQ